MRRTIKKPLILFCGLVSLIASLLSIIATLGYLGPTKRLLGLP